MKISSYDLFRSDLLQSGLEYAAMHAAHLGFDAVEFLDNMTSDEPSLLELLDPEQTKRILDSYGLGVSCYSVATQLYTENPQAVEKTLCKHAELAATLGSPYFHHTLILTPPASFPTYDSILDGIVSSAKKVAEHCNSLGLTTLYEPQGVYFNAIEGIQRFYRIMKSSHLRVGICGDLGNSLFADVAPIDFTKAFAKEIRHVHVKDYQISDKPFENKKCSQTHAGSWIARAKIGEGDADLAGCFSVLRNANYTGDFSLEIKADDETMIRSIAYIRRFFP